VVCVRCEGVTSRSRRFAWNNFLHATFEQIVGGVLESDNVMLQQVRCVGWVLV
jgi:hypothetical protein